ncbi:hypothetical protein F4860DRAFT_517918 [Xylaria cubensis]|nr:hypothetical protein F4860DRAFT_517918 [Xylaria cubensis]
MAFIFGLYQGCLAHSSLLTPERRKTAFIFLIGYVKGAWQEARVDLLTRWPLFFLILWFAGLFTILVILGLLSPPSAACRPDDTFSIYKDYSYWDSSGFFQITIAFGSFTFTEVKIIDIAWDVVVGRIGQGILAFLSWRTTFTTIFMESGPSLTSIYQSLRDFVVYRRLKSKASTAWVLLSMLFILVWPTFVAAMSGYTPKSGAYVKDVNENFVPYNEFQLLLYIIHDGERINLTTDYPVPYHETHIADDPTKDLLLLKDPTWKLGRRAPHRITLCHMDVFCAMSTAVSEYIQNYGIGGHLNDSSQWRNHWLPSPSLNIEPFFVPDDLLEGLNLTSAQNPEPTWTYANHTYTLEDIIESGACKTVGESFQWGFSYIQLFTIVFLLIIWTSGTCLLRYQTHKFPPLQDQPERPRGLRALILLAEAVKSDLEANGIDPHTLTNRQLNRLIYQNLKGGSASFGFRRRKKHVRLRFLQWAKQDLGWQAIAAVLVGVSLGFGGLLFPLLLVVNLMAYFIGTTTKSRLFFFIVLIPIPFIVWATYGDWPSRNATEYGSGV